METTIPIQNIYYLLCYAWGLPEKRDWVRVDADSCPAVLDLLARLLNKGAELLLKRGLAKEYVTRVEDIPGVKGKLELAQTLKLGRYREGKTICSFDELTGDILLNQIVFTALFNILRNKEVDKVIHNDLLRTFTRFPRVQTIQLTKSVFKKVQLNRNNRFYRLILNVCELLSNCLLPENNRPGQFSFMDFTKDEKKMDALFESFLRNFYKEKCSEQYPIIQSTIFNFKLIPLESKDASALPVMKTDVTMDNPSIGKRIILDAKFYNDMLTSRYESPKLIRDHISQIMSYVQNQEDTSRPYTLQTTGIMVYPRVNTMEVDYNYQQDGHRYRFSTVDLAQDWRYIEHRLQQIIQL